MALRSTGPTRSAPKRTSPGPRARGSSSERALAHVDVRAVATATLLRESPLHVMVPHVVERWNLDTNPSRTTGTTDGGWQCSGGNIADVNADGMVDLDDINPFVGLPS